MLRLKKVNVMILLPVVTFILFASISYLIITDIDSPIPEVEHSISDNEEIVYFGVISRYSPRSIISGYDPLMKYLSDNTPYTFKLKLSRNYLETVNQLAEGIIDFASLGNYTYINAHRSYGVRCIAMPINKVGSLKNYDDIIVKQDSPAQSLEDLRGNSFAFASKQSFSSWMGIWMLKDAGVSIEQLSRYEHHSYHDLVAEKVLRGDFDAGIVKTIVAEKYAPLGIRTLSRSPAIPSVPLVAAPHVDTARVRIVQQALLELVSLIETDQIDTKGWDAEVANGFMAGNDTLYNFPRQILAELEHIP